ncbi:MAG: RHS repeat protein, partial [Chloroflexi bacterium]|nr:RHS repeat protein [Chloroflexota bacterium]
RLDSVNYVDDGETVSYEYDAVGNRRVMTDSVGITSYDYDDLYRLITVTNPFTGTVGYDYDDAGNRNQLTYPDDKIVTYAYDADNRLTHVHDWSGGNGSGYFMDSEQRLGIAHSQDIALGDVDGDGDLDAFVANDGHNRLWLNNGDGIFSDSGQSLGNYDAVELQLGDLDGDGDLDAFVANGGSDNEPNQVWLNNGQGVFTNSGQNLGNAWSYAAPLGDLDGDGDLDAFVGNRFSPDEVWLNDGGSQFTNSGQSLGNAVTWAVSLGDLDGDGDLDAFVSNIGPNQVWQNDGSGNFSNSGQNLGNAATYNTALGDVDDDGDLDAFVVQVSNSNRLLLNDGNGNFTDSGQHLGSDFSWDVSLTDLDGDGDLDAFISAVGNRVWLNQGNAQGGTVGIFANTGQEMSSYLGDGVGIGDLDGDSDPDAFIANSNGGEPNTVWLNASTTTYQYDVAGRLITTTLPNGVITVNGYDAANRLTSLHQTDSASGQLVAE